MSVASRPFQTRDVTLKVGHRLRYHEWPGEGPPLIMLHGSGSYGLVWQGVADHLGKKFRVFALDQRGHGDSDRPDGDYSAEEYAEDLHQFIGALGLGRVILLGHSLGGRVSQVFAAVHPDEVLGIVLSGVHLSNFFLNRDTARGVMESVAEMINSQTEFASRDEAIKFLQDARPTDKMEMTLHRLNANMTEEGGRYRVKYDNVRVAQGYAHMSVNLRPYAARVKCPVTILRSTRGSELKSMEFARDLAKCWKDAEVVEVDSERLIYSSPAGVAAALTAFADGRLKAMA